MTGRLAIAQRRSEAIAGRKWKWGIWGVPGARKTIFLKSIIQNGDFGEVLLIDAEEGDMSLGDVNCDVIYPMQYTQKENLAHPWIAFTKIVDKLEEAAKRKDVDFPYGLIICEGATLLSGWCEDRIIQEIRTSILKTGDNSASRHDPDLSSIGDHRRTKSRMVAELFRLKALPCFLIVTARERNDPEYVDISGKAVKTGDHFSPGFIPSLAREFEAIFDIVSRIYVKRVGTDLKVFMVQEHTSESLGKDRFNLLDAIVENPHKIENTKKILEQLSKYYHHLPSEAINLPTKAQEASG